MSRYVTPETIARRFGVTLAELERSRRRGLRPGSAGYTIPAEGGGRRLVYPADLHPTIAENPDAAAEAVEAIGRRLEDDDE